MKHPVSKQIRKGCIYSIGVVVTFILALYVYKVVTTPNREEQLNEFLGDGHIVDSSSSREGFDSCYWARYKCDPEAVRNYISKHDYSNRKSDTQRLENYFLNPPFAWPPNIDHFQNDWIVFTVEVGVYRLVAFPDDDTDEVFYLEFDT